MRSLHLAPCLSKKTGISADKELAGYIAFDLCSILICAISDCYQRYFCHVHWFPYSPSSLITHDSGSLFIGAVLAMFQLICFVFRGTLQIVASLAMTCLFGVMTFTSVSAFVRYFYTVNLLFAVHAFTVWLFSIILFGVLYSFMESNSYSMVRFPASSLCFFAY